MIFINTIKKQNKKHGKKMTWKENMAYHRKHLDDGMDSNLYLTKKGATIVDYHGLCWIRAKQHVNGLGDDCGFGDLRKRTSISLYAEAAKKNNYSG